MGKLFENPKEYFESLSRDEFKQILYDYGFSYIDIKSLDKDEKDMLKKSIESAYSKTIDFNEVIDEWNN